MQGREKKRNNSFPLYLENARNLERLGRGPHIIWNMIVCKGHDKETTKMAAP